MSATRRRCSAALRCAAAAAAGLLWAAPSAQAAPMLATTASSSVLTSASWRVVITTATAPPYAASAPATLNGALLGPQYFTIANIGTRQPSSVTYRLTSGPGLAVTAALCTVPWSTTSGCAGGSTSVSFNSPVPASSVPAVGAALYLRVNVTVAGAGTLQAEASRPTSLTTNA